MKNLPQCNRDMYLDEDAFYDIDENGYKEIIKKQAKKPITFNDKLKEAFNNRKSNFLYQNKDFYLKKDKNDSEIIYLCNETEILGELFTDGEEFIIEYSDNESENKIYSFQPSKEIIQKQYTKEDDDFEK